MSYKVFKEIEQRTEAWYKVRYGKIGGTASSGLFTESESLMLELIGAQTEEFEMSEGFQSADMIRGQELEPLALSELEKYTGEKFINVGWIQNEVYSLLGLSPDGITEDYTVAAEVKCFAIKNHIKVCLTNEIPKENRHQAVHYFTVNPNLKKLHWACFRPENKLKPLHVITLERETLFDIGMTKKGKVKEDRGHGMKEYVCVMPDLRPISEWVEISLAASRLLEDKIKKSIEQLNF